MVSHLLFKNRFQQLTWLLPVLLSIVSTCIADRLVVYDIRTDRWLGGCVASSTSSKLIEDKVFGACFINSMSEDLKG